MGGAMGGPPQYHGGMPPMPPPHPGVPPHGMGPHAGWGDPRGGAQQHGRGTVLQMLANLESPDEIPWGLLSMVARDPDGSRLLQARLPGLPAAQLERAIRELKPDLFELSRHMCAAPATIPT
eukprot:599170-Prymnesium_polylepis.1